MTDCYYNFPMTGMVTRGGQRKRVIMRNADAARIALNGHAKDAHGGKVKNECPACKDLSKQVAQAEGMRA